MPPGQSSDPVDRSRLRVPAHLTSINPKSQEISSRATLEHRSRSTCRKATFDGHLGPPDCASSGRHARGRDIGHHRSMAAERNKARVLELIDRVTNGHDLTALEEFTSNPAVVGSARGLLQAFPDLRADVRWIVAEDDMVVVFHDVRGTQAGPWLFVREPRTASADVVHARIQVR
jgi:hypothetical protein